MSTSPMSQEPPSSSLTLYIPDRRISGRDLAELLLLVESSLVWSQIALAIQAREEAQREYRQNSGEVEARAIRRRNAWDEQISLVTGSFDQFLRNKYDAIIYQAQAYGAPSPFPLEQLLRLLDREKERSHEVEYWLERLYSEYPFDPERLTSRIRHRYSLEGDQFQVSDFTEWIGEQFGRELVKIRTINPDASIEFLLDVGAITAIVALQDYPAIKQTITYCTGVLKSYIGKLKKPIPKERMSPPKLSPSMLTFLGQYNEVNLKWDGDNGRLEMALKRSKNRKSKRQR